MSTTTTRLGLYKTADDGSELVNVSTDLLQNLDAIDLNIGFRDCTSSTRPSTVWKGLPIRESDTGRLYVSNGTAPASGSWKQIPAEGASFLAAFTYASTLAVTGAATLSSTLAVTGAATLGSTLAVTGSASLNSTLAVTGAATLSSTLAVTGNTTITGNLTVTGIGQTQTVYKSADESLTSNTTLQNDDELAFTVVAGAKYILDMFIKFVANAGTGDIKIAFTIPSGATMEYAALGTGSANFTDYDCSIVSAGTARAARGNSPVPQSINTRGNLVTVGSGGTLRLQWAQNSSSGTATVVKAGSWGRLTRVA